MQLSRSERQCRRAVTPEIQEHLARCVPVPESRAVENRNVWCGMHQTPILTRSTFIPGEPLDELSEDNSIGKVTSVETEAPHPKGAPTVRYAPLP